MMVPARFLLASRSFAVVTALAAVLNLAGCQSESGVPDAVPDLPVHPVKGKVIAPRSGSLAGAKITLVPAKFGSGARDASGVLADDGSFELTTVSKGDGAADGTYKVKIEPPPQQIGEKAKRSLIPPQYLDEDGSGITVTIQSSTTTLDPIKLTEQGGGTGGKAR